MEECQPFKLKVEGSTPSRGTFFVKLYHYYSIYINDNSYEVLSQLIIYEDWNCSSNIFYLVDERNTFYMIANNTIEKIYFDVETN